MLHCLGHLHVDCVATQSLQDAADLTAYNAHSDTVLPNPCFHHFHRPVLHCLARLQLLGLETPC